MVTVEHDGFTVETNTGDEASVRTALGVEAPADESAEAEAQTDGEQRLESPEGAGGDGAAAAASAEPVQPAKKAKPRDNPQARIAQEIERRKASDARAEKAEAELAALKAQTPRPEPAKPEKPAAETRPKPSANDVGTKYPTYEDYIEDLADWKAEQREAARKPPADLDAIVEQRLQARDAERQRQQAAADHQARVQAFQADHPDYQEQIDAADAQLAEAGVQLSPAVHEAVVGSGQSAALIYWLATHPDDLFQLAADTNGLDASAAPLVRQLLEARLGSVASAGSGPAVNVSRAKPPIKPVGATPPVTPDEGSDDEPFERYFARENAKARKAGRL